jgi:enoyl-CoA hydratase/carnithine racemase
MGRTIGHAAAERLVLSGRMVAAPEALALGLVDSVVPAADDASVLAAATEWMEAAVKLPPAARAATKRSGRDAFCAEWRRYYTEEEAAYGWAAISSPAAVATLLAVLQRLSSGGGGAKAKAGSKL